MRKILILAILVLTAVIAGILFIRDDWQNTDLANKTTKVGLLLNGSRSDRSFSQAHYEALESLQDELKLEIVCRENVPADCYKDIESLIRDKGCEIIVGVSYGFGESMKKAAEEHPNVYFLHATGTGHSSNLSSFFGRMYQARYLSFVWEQENLCRTVKC